MTSVKLKYNIASFPTLRVNFWAIPKCGNTTLKFALIRTNNPAAFDLMRSQGKTHDDIEQWVHQAGNCAYITPETANSNGFVNFTVVRDPIDRFTSGYQDFTQKRPMHKMVGSKYFVNEFEKLRKKPTMEHLLEILQNTTDAERDMHFKSQTSYCAQAKDLLVLSLGSVAENISLVHSNIIIDEHLHQTPPIPPLRTMLNVYITDVYRDDVGLYRSAISKRCEM